MVAMPYPGQPPQAQTEYFSIRQTAEPFLLENCFLSLFLPSTNYHSFAVKYYFLIFFHSTERQFVSSTLPAHKQHIFFFSQKHPHIPIKGVQQV